MRGAWSVLWIVLPLLVSGCEKLGAHAESDPDAVDAAPEPVSPQVEAAVAACLAGHAARSAARAPLPSPSLVAMCGAGQPCALALPAPLPIVEPPPDPPSPPETTLALTLELDEEPPWRGEPALWLLVREAASGELADMQELRPETGLRFGLEPGRYDLVLLARRPGCDGLPSGELVVARDVVVDGSRELTLAASLDALSVPVTGTLALDVAAADAAYFAQATWGLVLVPKRADGGAVEAPFWPLAALVREDRFAFAAAPGTYDLVLSWRAAHDTAESPCDLDPPDELGGGVVVARDVTIGAEGAQLALEAAPIVLDGVVEVDGALPPPPLWSGLVGVGFERLGAADEPPFERVSRVAPGEPFSLVLWPGEYELRVVPWSREEEEEAWRELGVEREAWDRVEHLSLESSRELTLGFGALALGWSLPERLPEWQALGAVPRVVARALEASAELSGSPLEFAVALESSQLLLAPGRYDLDLFWPPREHIAPARVALARGLELSADTALGTLELAAPATLRIEGPALPSECCSQLHLEDVLSGQTHTLVPERAPYDEVGSEPVVHFEGEVMEGVYDVYLEPGFDPGSRHLIARCQPVVAGAANRLEPRPELRELTLTVDDIPEAAIHCISYRFLGRSDTDEPAWQWPRHARHERDEDGIRRVHLELPPGVYALTVDAEGRADEPVIVEVR